MLEGKLTKEQEMKKKAMDEREMCIRSLNKAKGKLVELNKKTLDSIEFEYEKRVAINEAIKNMIWTIYIKSPDFDPLVLVIDIVNLVIEFKGKESNDKPFEKITHSSREVDETLVNE